MTTISKELPIAVGGEKQKSANSSSDYSGHRFLRSRIDSAHVRVEVIQLTRSSTDLKVDGARTRAMKNQAILYRLTVILRVSMDFYRSTGRITPKRTPAPIST